MSLHSLVKDYLENEVQFRERKNKDRGIMNILVTRHGLTSLVKDGIITKEKLVRLIQDYTVMDRAWRQILEQTPYLRGSDYKKKDELENKKLVSLGYRSRESGSCEVFEREARQEKLI